MGWWNYVTCNDCAYKGRLCKGDPDGIICIEWKVKATKLDELRSKEKTISIYSIIENLVKGD
jgi:hypothetical protein